MAKLTKLLKVSDSLSINRYDNGWMLELSGKDKENDWKTTKATADACYVLLLKGRNLLADEPEIKTSTFSVSIKRRMNNSHPLIS